MAPRHFVVANLLKSGTLLTRRGMEHTVNVYKVSNASFGGKFGSYKTYEELELSKYASKILK